MDLFPQEWNFFPVLTWAATPPQPDQHCPGPPTPGQWLDSCSLLHRSLGHCLHHLLGYRTPFIVFLQVFVHTHLSSSLPSRPKKPTQSSFLFCPQNALHSQTHRPQAQSSSTALPPCLLFLGLGTVSSSSYGRLKGGR
uniref:Uncharacterized protein n=1 Tax=Pipistrellus kuhlii TaxID=59472 RepID=A0A7J7TXJ2_PIPKU|nr:hypothetical protein mPipKuh1_009203 [Pipistrellus kuhlii]